MRGWGHTGGMVSRTRTRVASRETRGCPGVGGYTCPCHGVDLPLTGVALPLPCLPAFHVEHPGMHSRVSDPRTWGAIASPVMGGPAYRPRSDASRARSTERKPSAKRKTYSGCGARRVMRASWETKCANRLRHFQVHGEKSEKGSRMLAFCIRIAVEAAPEQCSAGRAVVGGLLSGLPLRRAE